MLVICDLQRNGAQGDDPAGSQWPFDPVRDFAPYKVVKPLEPDGFSTASPQAMVISHSA